MGGGVIDYCSFKRPCWDWSSTQKNKEIPCFVDPCSIKSGLSVVVSVFLHWALFLNKVNLYTSKVSNYYPSQSNPFQSADNPHASHFLHLLSQSPSRLIDVFTRYIHLQPPIQFRLTHLLGGVGVSGWGNSPWWRFSTGRDDCAGATKL